MAALRRRIGAQGAVAAKMGNLPRNLLPLRDRIGQLSTLLFRSAPLQAAEGGNVGKSLCQVIVRGSQQGAAPSQPGAQ
eukprot:6110390-Pleurochrysis_carterae.AAC.1